MLSMSAPLSQKCFVPCYCDLLSVRTEDIGIGPDLNFCALIVCRRSVTAPISCADPIQIWPRMVGRISKLPRSCENPIAQNLRVP